MNPTPLDCILIVGSAAIVIDWLRRLVLWLFTGDLGNRFGNPKL